MKESMMAFILWILIGAGFIIGGIVALFAKKAKPFGFWANAEVFPVKDVRAYNKALGKLFIVFGIIFMLLGIPFLKGQNSGGMVFSILGTMFLSIFTMVIYVTRIERKYRKS